MNNKGITLTSLIVYIVGFVVLATVLFTTNTLYSKEIFSNRATTIMYKEFDKACMYLLDDTKNSDSANVINGQLAFDNGTIYKFKNNRLYRNDIEIIGNLELINYSISTENNCTKLKTDFKFSKYNAILEKSIVFVFGRGYNYEG